MRSVNKMFRGLNIENHCFNQNMLWLEKESKK